MTYDDDIPFGEDDQPPLQADLGGWDLFDPDFNANSPEWYWDFDRQELIELPETPPKPQALGVRGGLGLDPLSFSQIQKIIPMELQAGPTWCVWIFEYLEGGRRWKKRPHLPFRGNRGGYFPASAAKPQNWIAITKAFEALLNDKEGRLDGLGRFFSADDPFTGIDLDHCFDELGNLNPWAAEILAMFPGAYAEYSPSGRGLKLWTRARLPGRGLKVVGFGPDETGAVEIYDRDRYFTVTARPYGEPVKAIADGSAAVRALSERLGGKCGDEGQGAKAAVAKPPAPTSGGAAVPARPTALSDDQVIARARKAYPEFGMLFDSGDLSKHSNNWSQADAALVKQIAYFAGGDRVQIERIWGMSALARREKFGREDYRSATISAVLARMTAFYDPNFRTGARRSASGGSSQWGLV